MSNISKHLFYFDKYINTVDYVYNIFMHDVYFISFNLTSNNIIETGISFEYFFNERVIGISPAEVLLRYGNNSMLVQWIHDIRIKYERG